jgi:hypothetical protein
MHKFRQLKLLLLFLFDRRPRDPLQPVVCRFLVTPLDAELTRAASQAYLAFAGLARWYYVFLNVDWRGLLRERWVPLTHSEMIQYRRAATLFSTIEVTTKIIWWNEKMVYFEHRFMQADMLSAISFSRGTFYRGRQRLDPRRCLVGLPEVPPMSKPGIVTFWDGCAEYFQDPSHVTKA